MYKGYQIVCTTPAGRRRYMKLLAPYLLSSELVDRWDIWVNTVDEGDINFFEELGKKFEKVNLVKNPEGQVNGNASINWFYSTAIERNTIYVKFDDDIVWVEDGFFETLLDYRIENRSHLLVFPAIVNNAVCTHLFQQKKKLKFSEYIFAICFDRLAWACPDFATELHKWFLKHVEGGSVDALKFEPVLIALNRISINCVSWIGEDFAEFGGIILDDDEEYLTVIKPRELRKINSICGSTLVSHFAFYPQRKQLDRGGILEAYESVAQNSENKTIAGIYQTVNSILAKEPPRKNAFATVAAKKCKELCQYVKFPWLEWVSLGEFYRRFKLMFKKQKPKHIVG